MRLSQEVGQKDSLVIDDLKDKMKGSLGSIGMLYKDLNSCQERLGQLEAAGGDQTQPTTNLPPTQMDISDVVGENLRLVTSQVVSQVVCQH